MTPSLDSRLIAMGFFLLQRLLQKFPLHFRQVTNLIEKTLDELLEIQLRIELPSSRDVTASIFQAC